MRQAAFVLAALLVLPATADAGCRMASAGAKCAAPPVTSPALAAGDPLPEAEARLLLNPGYYGLPPSDGSWRYYVVRGQLYRVDAATGRVIAAEPAGNRQVYRQLR